MIQKQALTTAEVCEALGMSLLKNRKWHVQGAVAIRGEGLYEGLDWWVLWCHISDMLGFSAMRPVSAGNSIDPSNFYLMIPGVLQAVKYIVNNAKKRTADIRDSFWALSRQ